MKKVMNGLSKRSYIVPSQTHSEQYQGPLSGGSISTTSEMEPEFGGVGSFFGSGGESSLLLFDPI